MIEIMEIGIAEITMDVEEEEVEVVMIGGKVIEGKEKDIINRMLITEMVTEETIPQEEKIIEETILQEEKIVEEGILQEEKMTGGDITRWMTIIGGIINPEDITSQTIIEEIVHQVERGECMNNNETMKIEDDNKNQEVRAEKK